MAETNIGVEVAAGVYALQLAMPSGRSSYCYGLLSPQGTLTLVDPGWALPENLARIELFYRQLGLPWQATTGIVVTHFHPDHCGWAAELARRSAAVVYAPQAEKSHLAQKTATVAEQAIYWRAQAQAAGVPEQQLPQYMAQLPPLLSAEQTPPVQWLADGAQIPDAPGWMLLTTPGHTCGQSVLVQEQSRLLLSSDHLMRGQSPGLGLGGCFSQNPLRAYRESLERIAGYDGFLTLAGHGEQFHDIRQQSAFSLAHHLRRRDEVAAAIERSPSGAETSSWELAQQVRWSGGFASLRGFRLRSALNHVRIFAQELCAGPRGAD